MIKKYFNDNELDKILKNDNLIDKSLQIITKLFNDKLDKGNSPYVVHLLKVYSGVNNDNEKIVALLHDVLENTDVEYNDLLEMGYNKDIADAIVILTKKKGEDYRDYIDRIIKSNNKIALNVKLSDLKCNMDINRIKNPTTNDYERIHKRYEPAYDKILNKLNEEER